MRLRARLAIAARRSLTGRALSVRWAKTASPGCRPGRTQGRARDGGPGPALTWAGRSPTSCRVQGPTGSSGETRERGGAARGDARRAEDPAGRDRRRRRRGGWLHSIRLARRVGPKGTVYATDVQPEMLRMLASNARAAGLTNIKPVRCTQTDPRLPEGQVDLILMVDVYHECSDPEATLQGPAEAALKPGGRLVLVEFRGEDPDVPIKPEHKMTLTQVRRELEPQGFTFKESLEFLPWQHIIIFEKPANPGANDDPTRKPDAKASQADRKQDHSARSYASREARSAVVRSLPSIPTRGVSEDLSHQAARTCGEPR